MSLEKETKNIDIAIEKIKEKLNQLYYRLEKSDFTTKSYIFDIFSQVKDIEVSNYFLKRDFKDLKK